MLYTHGKPTITLPEIRKSYKVPTKADLRAKLGANATKGTGSRWTPVHHADLIDDIHAAVAQRGMAVKTESFILSEDSHSIYGNMQFEGYDLGRSDMAPVLGFRSDNLQRFRLVGVTGARVFICENGAVIGDFVFGFKHTSGNVEDIEVGIEDGLVKWESQAKQMKRFVEFMETQILDVRDADHLLLEACRERIIASNQLSKIDATYRAYTEATNPHHSAFGERNVWSLYNAVTEVAKGWRSPMVGERGMKGFPRLAAKAFGFEGLDELADAAIDPSLN